MPPNKTDNVAPAANLLPYLKRLFPDLTQLSIPTTCLDQWSLYIPPPPPENRYNRFANIFIDPNAIPQPTLFADIMGPNSFESPIIKGGDPAVLDEKPAEETPLVTLGTFYERWRIPTSPVSIEELSGVFVRIKLWDDWSLELRNEIHSYPDPNNPNNF